MVPEQAGEPGPRAGYYWLPGQTALSFPDASAVHTHLDLTWSASTSQNAVRDVRLGVSDRMATGLPLAVKDGASILSDAAEEISLHLAERVERREHGERRITAGRSTRRITIDQINDYLEKSRADHDARKRALEVRDVLEQAWRDEGRLGRDASQRTPTDHYLLLQQALLAGRAEAAPAAVMERLERAVAEVEAEADVHVQADLVTIDQAAHFGQTAQGIAGFQASLHTLLDKPTLAQAFREALALADKDGRRLDSAIDHLMEAIGNCLYALGTTREKVLLQTLVTDLYHLKCLNTLVDEARSVVREIRRSVRHATAQEPIHGAAP